MKKILLINPGHDKPDEPHKHISYRTIHRDPPPVALLSIGSYLAENGYEIDIIDTHIEDNYKKIIFDYIDANDYLYVGMTVIIGKFLSNAVELTRFIRETAPDLPVVWGGIMASIAPDQILKKYGWDRGPDYIVRFEGEETSLALAKALEGSRPVNNIEGISFKIGKSVFHTNPRIPPIDLDEYPIPRWDLLGEKFNKEQLPYFYMIMTSRGCPFNCTFCYKHSIEEGIRLHVPPWRYRSAEHIIKELDYIHDSTGTKVFTFGDDNFLVRKGRAFKVLDYLKKKNWYIEECIGHLNNLTEDLIDRMAGTVQTFIFSIETASPRLQKIINKKLNLKSVPKKVKKMFHNGIVPTANFIVGLPTETVEDLKKNVEIMIDLKRLNPIIRGRTNLFLPLPETKLFKYVEEQYSIKLIDDIHNYEVANQWCKKAEDETGRKFRPWLSGEEYDFLISFGQVFNDVFKKCGDLKEETISIMEGNPEIRKLFNGIEKIRRPPLGKDPYVLDQVLRGEEVDLANSLKNLFD